ALAKIIRAVDLLGSWDQGGFALLLPSTHFAGALPVAQRIQSALRTLQVTVSLGAAFFPSQQVTTVDQLMDQAGAALERARTEGPGWVCLQQHQSYLYRPDAK